MLERRRDLVAQWAFDTRSILGRFHLWLENVEHRHVVGGGLEAEPSFVGPALERALVVATGVTALGTKLFGRYGEGAGLDKAGLNRVKKDADAVSAYLLSESLWYLTRNLPENHALLVALGEGLMPKAGETPEMGSNPLLGFGRVYARPFVAKAMERLVNRMLNDETYHGRDFRADVARDGLEVWSAAIDTLENTSRFAKGAETGPLTVLHLYDQPLEVESPYEGYVGTLTLPREVVDTAEAGSVFISYHTPRVQVLTAIRETYPNIDPQRVHVWTLGGPSRKERLGDLWREWGRLGVHVVEDGWRIPGGGEVFTDSGTYAPMSRVGAFTDEEGHRHVFLIDGYAATAEAIQAASLDPILGTCTVMSLFSATFAAPHHREREVTALDPEGAGFAEELAELLRRDADDDLVAAYRDSLRAARRAGMPTRPFLRIDDFFPRKEWSVLALAGYMLPDPYTGLPGIEEVGDRTWRVTVRASTKQRISDTVLTLRFVEDLDESRLVCSPLLDRFSAGEDFRARPVKISDSGRIRNELQTLISEALEHTADGGIRVHFDRVDPAVLPADKQKVIRDAIAWYKKNHPYWFRWLEVAR